MRPGPRTDASAEPASGSGTEPVDVADSGDVVVIPSAPAAASATLVPHHEQLPQTVPVAAEPRTARRRWIAVAGLLLLLVAAGAAARLWYGPRVPVAPVVQRDFVQTVVASGRVESPHRVDIGVQLTGIVSRVPVDEGQIVTPGTVLIELDDRELRATAAQADLAVTQAEARVRQLREVDLPSAEQAVRQAQVNHVNAVRTLERNRELNAKGFIGQAALDESARAEQVAHAQLRTAEQQLAGTRAGGSGEMSAIAALQAARAAAEAAHARQSYAVVRAPLAGTLIARDVEAGDVVQPGKALMVLSPAGDTQVVIQVDEKNMRLLRVGQPALASSDAYPDQRFAARVAYVNPGVDAQRGAVEVKLAVPQPPDYLRQDMTVSVDIEAARRAAAVLVATDAVHDPDGTAPWVLKVDHGRVRRQPIVLGLRSSGWCEVLQGLHPGDQVVRTKGSQAATIGDGARVRPVAAEK